MNAESTILCQMKQYCIRYDYNYRIYHEAIPQTLLLAAVYLHLAHALISWFAFITNRISLSKAVIWSLVLITTNPVFVALYFYSSKSRIWENYSKQWRQDYKWNTNSICIAKSVHPTRSLKHQTGPTSPLIYSVDKIININKKLKWFIMYLHQ